MLLAILFYFIFVQLSRVFDLVLLTERFNEGLVMLRRMMGWKLDDLMFTTHNENKAKVTSR